MKRVVAACIDRLLEFDSKSSAEEYIRKLEEKKTVFRILQHGSYEDGSYRMRIQEKYCSCPFID